MVALLNEVSQFAICHAMLGEAKNRLDVLEHEILHRKLTHDTYLEKRAAAEELRQTIKAMETILGRKERES